MAIFGHWILFGFGCTIEAGLYVTSGTKVSLYDEKNKPVDLGGQSVDNDQNVVKVVCDIYGNALYFSREPIPSQQNVKSPKTFKQYGIIIFQRDFLLKYLEMEPTPLEKVESIDMLRIVENGIPIKMILSKFNIYTVDTPSELIQVEDLIRTNNNY